MSSGHLTDDELVEFLASAKTVAVVGASPKEERPSHQAVSYLQARGYEVFPVNPAAHTIAGLPVYASLAAIPVPIDIVNVFRNVVFVPPLIDECINMQVRGIWTQLDIVHEESAEKARAAGITVVMDRCIMVDYSRLSRRIRERRNS